jgi:hypothetical protein
MMIVMVKIRLDTEIIQILVCVINHTADQVYENDKKLFYKNYSIKFLCMYFKIPLLPHLVTSHLYKQ